LCEQSLIGDEVLWFSPKQSGCGGSKSEGGIVVDDDLAGYLNDFTQTVRGFWFVIQPRAETSQPGGREAICPGGGKTGDQSVRRGLFSAKLDEFLDEDIIIKSGLGKVIKVKMCRAEHSGPNEGVVMIFHRQLSQSAACLRTRRGAQRAGGLKTNGGVWIVSEIDGPGKEVWLAFPSRFGKAKGVTSYLGVGIAERGFNELRRETVNAIENAKGMKAGLGERVTLGHLGQGHYWGQGTTGVRVQILTKTPFACSLRALSCCIRIQFAGA